jgi:hypothetical protein
MSQTVIDEIRRTEERAEEMKAEAAAGAREMVRAVEEEMITWKDQQMKRARLEARETIEAAEAAANRPHPSRAGAGRVPRRRCGGGRRIASTKRCVSSWKKDRGVIGGPSCQEG